MSGRRNFLRLSAAALAMPWLASLSGCGTDRPLRVAVQPWCGYQFLFIARQEGWLKAQAIELVETALTRDSVEALKQGKVDAAALTLDEVLLLREQGHPLQVVMVFNISAGADVLLAKPDIRTLQQLKGKRIGVETSSLGKIMLNRVLQAAGLQRTELIVVPMGEDHLQHYQQAPMDAVLTYEPNLGKLRALGLQPIYDSRQAPNLILDVLAVTPEAASNHSEALRTLIAGHFRALRLWRTNPLDTSYILAPRLQVEPTQVAKVYQGLDLPDALYNLEYLSPPAATLTGSAESLAAIMREAGVLKQKPELSDLYLADFLPSEGALRCCVGCGCSHCC